MAGLSRDYYLFRFFRRVTWYIPVHTAINDKFIRHIPIIMNHNDKTAKTCERDLSFFFHLMFFVFQRAVGASSKVVTLMEQATTKLRLIKLRRNITPLTEFRYSTCLWYHGNPLAVTLLYYNRQRISTGKILYNYLTLYATSKILYVKLLFPNIS